MEKDANPKLIWLSERNAGILIDAAVIRANGLLDRGAARTESLVEVQGLFIAASAALTTASESFHEEYDTVVRELGERIERESIEPGQNEIEIIPDEKERSGY